ncbi:MAG: hypothetical protein FJ030_15275 [Chloroflexi bacterium]|nr:hypothetical protein [Chloroflexota bacterium]
MDDPRFAYDLRDGLLCLGFLIGMAAAVSLMLRKQTLPGCLALAAFFLFSIDPIAEIIIWRILVTNWADDYNVLNWMYACVSGPAIFLGVIALVVALVTAKRQPEEVNALPR